eukprot:1160588-Pelagomonas_calceolata.AAC.7
MTCSCSSYHEHRHKNRHEFTGGVPTSLTIGSWTPASLEQAQAFFYDPRIHRVGRTTAGNTPAGSEQAWACLTIHVCMRVVLTALHADSRQAYAVPKGKPYRINIYMVTA